VGSVLVLRSFLTPQKSNTQQNRNAQQNRNTQQTTNNNTRRTKMSHAPKNPGYFDTIQFYFLEVTGKGIMFSARDMELLRQWRDEGATATVICRGIKEAISNMDDDDPPRGVYACQGWIEAEIERAREMATGGHAGRKAHSAGASEQAQQEQRDQQDHQNQNTSNAYADLFEEALANIERGGKAAGAEELRQVYRQAWRELKVLVEGSGVDDPFSELAAIEDAMVDGYFRALDRQEQDRIEDAISEQNRADLAIMSPEAREEHLAARRRKVLIRDYGLTPLIE
jgi:hypothetical protein